MDPLLATKLHIPHTRPDFVPRFRLIERLDKGIRSGRNLTLISAPAGFGKTTLVSEWMEYIQSAAEQNGKIPYWTAWLSLDEGDNDLTRFLSYFVAALNQIEHMKAGIGDEAIGLLRSPDPPGVRVVLTSLINELVYIPHRIIFILDDYQYIESAAVDDALAFLLECLPPQMQLVISTRVDPQLPLARLRARGQLNELRAADLRFTTSEAAEFLNRVMGLGLSAADISALETRTEGWIAGLQLAAISMQGSKDTRVFIKSFTGSHRFVMDYLIEEVLEQQPEKVQAFLQQTAVLNRMTGSLCDAVTGQENSQATLEMLERANLFILPLDNERHWYRYHQLFADLLRQRLQQNHPEQFSKLHQLASEWYEQKRLWPDAIRHTLAAKDFERAAVLLELAWRSMNMSYKSVTWLGWAKALPDKWVRSRPALNTAYGWALLDTGDLEAAEFHFRYAEKWLDTTVNVNEQLEVPTDKMVVLNEEELRSLSISIANGRAYLSQALGEVTATVKYAQQASDLLREDEYFDRGLSDVLMGFAYWASGNLEAAHKAVADAVEKMEMAGRIPFIISFTSYLADIMTAQGRLNETERTYSQLLKTVTEQGEPDAQERAVLHLGLSELYLERGDMEAARRHLQRSEELDKQPAFPPWYRHWVFAHARVMEAQKDLDGIIKLLNGAERFYYRHPIPDVRPLKALTARVWLAQGKLTKVLGWVRERGLSVDDDLSYLREFEHITLARLLIAQYKRNPSVGYMYDAMGLLKRLLDAAEEGSRMGSVIEILVLQTLAYEAQNDIPSALLSLKRAITLGEPEGYVRTFVRESAPVMGLLKRMNVKDKRQKEYIHKLLASFGGKELQTSSSGDQPLIEPLSEREIEVLQRIAMGLTNPEIAARLYLSLNTIKVHTRNIYGKLGVSNRTQAVARARALGILPAPDRMSA